MTQNGWGEYDEFLADAERDDRSGDHDFLVSSNDEGSWPSGETYRRISGVLLTAGQAKHELTYTPPPPAAALKELAGSMDRGRKRGIAQNIQMAKKVVEWYGKSVEDLKAGDVLRVKNVKTKKGFIRTISVLPKEQIGSKAEAKTALSDIPF